MLPIVVVALIKIGLVIGGLMTAAAYLVLGERWIAAWIQDRQGPNRVGVPLTKIRLFGLGQPLADGVKFLFKAEYTPAHVDKGLYFFAPMTIFVTAIAVFAVIPFGSFLPNEHLPGKLGRRPTDQPGNCTGCRRRHDLRLRHGQHRRLWRGAGRLGQQQQVQFPGWAAEQRQLIGYELPMGLGILGVVLSSGSLRLDTIMEHQAQTGAWNAFVQPLGMIVFCVAAFAEASRLPFDLPECEQELIGGYHTEYFGIKLMMYLVGEYLHMVTAAFLIVMLFFGGWHFWGLTGSSNNVTWVEAILRIVVLNVKVLGMVFFFMVARWSWARFRYDQLMSLAWLVMLPMGMVNVAYMAIWEEYGGAWAKQCGFFAPGRHDGLRLGRALRHVVCGHKDVAFR